MFNLGTENTLERSQAFRARIFPKNVVEARKKKTGKKTPKHLSTAVNKRDK